MVGKAAMRYEMSDERQPIVVRAMQWNDLPNISEVKPLSDHDAPVLREIREVLLKHGAIDRFGLMLLHKHFELQGGEELVEEVDVDRRLLVSRPRAIQDGSHSIDTAWRFDNSSENPLPTAVCFKKCRWKDGSSEHSGIMDHY
jgi:hypothetical protein